MTLRARRPRRPGIRPVAERRDRNDGAVLRRTLPLVAVVALVGAACGGPNVVVLAGPTEDVFVPQVVDAEGAVGRGISLAVDVDGNPHLAYLAFKSQTEAEGSEPEDPTAPVLPAIKHAHLVQGLWTRSVVADDQQQVGASDTTAIAVDGEGVHHVVWTAGDTLFYSNNSSGAEFSNPEEVASNVIGGLSATASGDQVAVAWYQGGFGAEGPGSIVRVARGQGGQWTVETAAEAGREREPSTGVGFDGNTILVAFGDSGRTMVARSGVIWVSEVADEDGGTGVSIDVDGDGNPHLAYANAGGTVKHAHSITGGAWQVNEVGQGADGPTSIAVDADGVHHVTWQTRQGLGYASNTEEEFQAEEVPASDEGELPRFGVGAEGTLYLAWYDAGGSEPILAVRSDREPLLAMPTASPTPGGGGIPTGPPPCEPSGTELTITAQTLAFDTDCLAAPVDEAFTIELNNQDAVPHNVAIYETQGGTAFFQGETFTGPDTRTYEVDPIEEPGQYYFQCDVHPPMSGTFVVQ